VQKRAVIGVNWPTIRKREDEIDDADDDDDDDDDEGLLTSSRLAMSAWALRVSGEAQKSVS
jgi:hypothetical protein